MTDAPPAGAHSGQSKYHGATTLPGWSGRANDQPRYQKRMDPQHSSHHSSSAPPFAKGQSRNPPVAALPQAAASASTRQAIASAVEGSTARLTAAFAKRDGYRQGKLAPQDFAQVVRDLGVELTPRALPGLTVANSNLSTDTVDYLNFIAGLEPQLGLAASVAAPQPAVPTDRGSKGVKNFGIHAHSARSNVPLTVDQQPPAGEATTLHHHEAFASAAGLGVERPPRHDTRRHHPTASYSAAQTHFVLGSPDTESAVDVSDATEEPKISAGRASAVGDEKLINGKRHTWADGTLPPAMRSNVDRVIFGRDLDGSEELPGGDAIGDDEYKPEAVKLWPHKASSIDEIVFGHDTDGSTTIEPFSSSAAFEGAAGMNSEQSAKDRLRGSADLDEAFDTSKPMVAKPHQQTTVDTVVFGHDIDGSDSAAARPDLESHRASGAAGQMTPRGGDADTQRPTKTRVEEPQKTGSVATSLTGWAPGWMSTSYEQPRSVRRGFVGGGRETTTQVHIAQKAHCGPPPTPSPCKPAAASYKRPSSATPAPAATPGAGTARTPGTPGSGVRVFSPMMKPPLPQSTRYGAAMRSPPRALEGVATIAQCGIAPTTAPIGPRAAWFDKSAAGRPSDSTTTRHRGADPTGKADPAAAPAAGRCFCTMSASERKWGGQLASSGGLG